MLNTLVSLFLTIFGALRAAPIYYSRILTLGNAFFARLDSGTTTTIETLSGIMTSTSVLHLPPSPVLLSLPAGTTSQLLGPSLALLAAVFTATIVLSGLIWHLTAMTVALVNDGLNMQAGDSKIHHTVIDLSGVTYNGHMFTSDGELAGLLASTTDTNTPVIPSPPVDAYATSMPTVESYALATPPRVFSHAGSEGTISASSKATSPLLAPTPLLPPSINNTITAPVEHSPTVREDNEGAWDTWINRRRRRPPSQPPPSAGALGVSRTRSSSVFSTSCTSDTGTLFSSMSRASTGPTSAPSSRRSSTAAFFPAKHPTSSFHSPTRTTTPSIASYTKFSVLEVFEVEG